MEQSKLYRCCNTCAYKNNSLRGGCSKASECFNGFSTYYPNPEMKKQIERAITGDK